MYISYILTAGIVAVAEPLVITLIGEKWRPCIIYLQLLGFVGAMYPLNALNLNMLNVKGRSDLYLNLEVIKKILAIPAIIIGVIWGIKVMIFGMWANTLIGYYLNSYYSGRLINYSMKEQVADILPIFLLALVTGTLMFAAGNLIMTGYIWKLTIQILLGGILVLGISELLKFEPYIEIKDIIRIKVIGIYNERK
jgi:O-antigen/teichoic acid export membrane protein